LLAACHEIQTMDRSKKQKHGVQNNSAHFL